MAQAPRMVTGWLLMILVLIGSVIWLLDGRPVPNLGAVHVTTSHVSIPSFRSKLTIEQVVQTVSLARADQHWPSQIILDRQVLPITTIRQQALVCLGSGTKRTCALINHSGAAYFYRGTNASERATEAASL